jgi:SepF-like predicted cell division protein (DUF552 family)
MPLDIFKKIKGKGSEDEEYLELSLDSETRGPGKMTLVIEKMDSYADAERIQKRVRDGQIVIMKIKDLKDKDVEELKRSIARVRKTCEAINGDIAGISEEWVVATPSAVLIERQRVEGEEENQ